MKIKVISLLVILGLVSGGHAFDLEDLNFTGQYRLRWQMMDNMGLVDDPDDFQEFMRNRIHLGLDGNVSENVYINIVAEFENTMGEDSDYWPALGRGWRPATGGSSFRLQTGYLRVSDLLTENLSLDIGRQNIFLGRGFVLTSDWAGLDGLKASYGYDELEVSALHYRLNSEGWSREDAYSRMHKTGLTASYSLPVTDITGYYIVDYASNKDDAALESDEKQFAGIFAQGGFDNFRHYAEYIMQSGSDAWGNDYDASLLYAALNYDIPDFHGLSLKGDYFLATGDDPATGDNEEFGSATMYGYFMDTFWYDYYLDAYATAVTGKSMADLEAIGMGFNLDIVPGLNFMAHYYMLSDEVAGDDIGDEVGVKLSAPIGEASSIFVTYSQFMPDASGLDDARFAALEYAVNF